MGTSSSTVPKTPSLATLFRESQHRLRQVIGFRLDRRLARRLDVEDVLQEAFVTATRRFHEYEASPSVSPFVWLRTIVQQTIIDLHRRHLHANRRDVRRERQLKKDSSTAAPALAARLAAKLTTPSGAAMRDEAAAELRQAIETLSDLDREILAMRHFEELTNAEVAEALGITSKTASIRYVRALARLKNAITAEGSDEL